jgi:hypothetical protein
LPSTLYPSQFCVHWTVVPQAPLHKGKEKNATLKWVNILCSLKKQVCYVFCTFCYNMVRNKSEHCVCIFRAFWICVWCYIFSICPLLYQSVLYYHVAWNHRFSFYTYKEC